MFCPTCKTALRTIRYEGVELDTCGRCGGEFVGPAEIAHVVRTREERFSPEVLAETAPLRPVFGPPEQSVRAAARCPSCAGEMRAVNYSGDTGVCVDRCERCHGLWLEHEELEKIQALLERWGDEAPGALARLSPEGVRAE